MSDVVIRAEGLGKKYLIGHQTKRERSLSLRDVVGEAAQGLARSFRDTVRGNQILVSDEVEEFWALKDVDFEIRRGEVAGIIGRNGAGKSTLLKVLSRITEPTTGRVTIRGRVASLLEVGTGFHPELTGRENIHLNGSILGMSRAQIKARFDEIVAFAEVEKFLDTPVKRYSSGMYVRLAFAVAAHLEPEILIVDEVLAVGDTEFQKKCLGKMQDVAGHGRTVLLVSHNMAAIRSLCQSALFMQQGTITCQGHVDEILSRYTQSMLSKAHANSSFQPLQRYGTGEIRILNASLHRDETSTTNTFHIGDPLWVECAIQGPLNEDTNLSVLIETPDDLIVAQMDSRDDQAFSPHNNAGVTQLRIKLGQLILQEGQYFISIGIHTKTLTPIDVARKCLSFSVLDDPSRSSRRYPSVSRHGLVKLASEWRNVDFKNAVKQS